MGAVVSIKAIDKIVGFDIRHLRNDYGADYMPLIALFSSNCTNPFAIQLVRASSRNTTSNYQIYYIVSHRPADVIDFRGQFSARNAIYKYDAAEICEPAQESSSHFVSVVHLRKIMDSADLI